MAFCDTFTGRSSKFCDFASSLSPLDHQSRSCQTRDDKKKSRSVSAQPSPTRLASWGDGGLCLVVPATCRAAATRRAPRVAPAPSVIRRVPATGRWATAITPVPVPVPISSIIPVVPVVTAVVGVAVTVATITVRIAIIVVAVITATVRVATTTATMTHIFTWSRCMGPVGNRVVNADSAAIQFLKSFKVRYYVRRKQ